MFSLAHLSDPHLGPLPAIGLRDLLSKRLLGYINWHRGRGRNLGAVALGALTDALKDVAPDHIAVTGDLINLAVEAEFATARQWLNTLGEPAAVTVVPGNHDAYVPGAVDRLHEHWGPYLVGDDPVEDIAFPFVRRRGPVALVGLSSAVATPPFFHTGRVGRTQTEALRATLDRLGAEGRFRVVLIHHPPFSDRRQWRGRLTDATALRRAIAEAGAELVLHGHNHIDTVNWIEGNGRRIPVVGVPSASGVPERPKPAATFHLFHIDGAPDAWSCRFAVHRLSADASVEQIGETVLAEAA